MVITGDITEALERARIHQGKEVWSTNMMYSLCDRILTFIPLIAFWVTQWCRLYF